MKEHFDHNVTGVVKECVEVSMIIDDDELEPNWASGEEMLEFEIVSAHCLDCDVWLIGGK